MISQKPSRVLSLDFLKAVGIVYIIILHQVIWTYFQGDGDIFRLRDGLEYGYWLGFAVANRGLHVLGFLLPVLAGSTFYLSYQQQGLKPSAMLKRIVFLMGLGFLMNILAWGLYEGFQIEDIFDWDVLQYVSLSAAVCFFVLSRFNRVVSFVILFILTIFALYFSDAYPMGEFRYGYLYRIIIGDPTGENYWPFCPWFSLFSCGVFLGWLVNSKNKRLFRLVIYLGVLLMILSFGSGEFFADHRVRNAWGPNLFKPSVYFVFGILGFALIAVPLTELLFRKKRNLCERLATSKFIRLGQGILWVYLFTTVFSYNLTVFIMNRVSIGFVSSFVLLCVLIMFNIFGAYWVSRSFVGKKKIRYNT